MTLKAFLWNWSVALSVLASSPGAHASEAPRDGRASVALVVPYRTVLEQELIRFTVRLRNESKEKIPYVADPFKAAGKQVFIKVDRGQPGFDGLMRTDSRPGLGVPKVRTIERDGNWDVAAKEASAVLMPGESVEWDGSRFDPMLFYIGEGNPSSIQAQVLVGPGQWVSSEPVRIKAIPTTLALAPVLFEGFRFYESARLKSKVRCPVTVHGVGIEGREYLFDGASGRICEIPKGTTPEIRWDNETGILTVRFPGTDLAPVRYNYPQMQVVPDQLKGSVKGP